MPPDTCPHCEAGVPPDARFCPNCGEAVATSDTGAQGPEGDLRSTSDGRTLASLTHVLGFFTWVIGPLVVLIVSDDPFVIQNAKNAVMWQLMVMIYGIISVILILFVVGLFLLVLLGLLDLIFCIVAAVKATDGIAWQYPLTPRV